ncbi:MAG: hypothetical protein QXQ94_10110 [Candidatus Bathyarchaeia archaeon]
MTRCVLCYPFTHNKAEFLIIFGNDEQQLHVCKWCLEDLKLLRFNANQIICLPKPFHFKVSFWFLGPVRSLLEAKA